MNNGPTVPIARQPYKANRKVNIVEEQTFRKEKPSYAQSQNNLIRKVQTRNLDWDLSHQKARGSYPRGSLPTVIYKHKVPCI